MRRDHLSAAGAARSIYELSTPQKILGVISAFVFCVILFEFFPAGSVDWHYTFYPVSQMPLQPYAVRTFLNLPWAALILYPIHFFGENLGCAINAGLNLVVIALLVIKRKGGPLPLFLTLTSLPLTMLIGTGSIEWIPALGFIFQNEWGLVLLLAKPQSGILAILTWLLSVKNKLLFFLPALLVILSAFLIWGNWPALLAANVKYMTTAKVSLASFNTSPFPYAVPIGLGLIFYMLKYRPANGEVLGVLATLCLAPYYFVHSLTIFFALLSVSHRRVGILVWILMWLYPFLILIERATAIARR
jgi:hypothetical protein